MDPKATSRRFLGLQRVLSTLLAAQCFPVTALGTSFCFSQLCFLAQNPCTPLSASLGDLLPAQFAQNQKSKSLQARKSSRMQGDAFVLGSWSLLFYSSPEAVGCICMRVCGSRDGVDAGRKRKKLLTDYTFFLEYSDYSG